MTTSDRRPAALPLRDLVLNPELIPNPSGLTESQRNGWSCVFCGDYTGGDAPIAGRMELLGKLAACFICFRAKGRPRTAGVA
jgi:hypothetical protein